MSNQTARVVRFHKAGDASVLKIDTLPVTEPKENEVRIKVAAFGLNRAEILFREDTYLVPVEFPSRIGYEASGTIDAVGSNVTEFKVGDSVGTVPAFSMSEYGVYAEYAVVPVEVVAKSPSTFNAEQSTAIWMQYITAYGALIELGNLQAGQYVIITAASSSVGVAAIQLAKNAGAIVIATTRGSSKTQYLRDKGADHVVETGNEDLVAAVAKITDGEGAPLIFDPVAGPMIEKLADSISVGGLMIEYGLLDSRPTPYPVFAALLKGFSIRGYTLFEITQVPERLQKAKDYLTPLFEAGKLIPTIDKVFEFEDVQKAHEYMESNQQVGKIVVRV